VSDIPVSEPAVDEAVSRSLQRARGVAPAVLAGIARSVAGDLRAVTPVAPAWLLAVRLLAACAAVAAAGAAWAGFDGIRGLAPAEGAALLATLAILAIVMARECVARWIPGSRVRLGSGALLAGSCGILGVLFALLFRDHHAEHFVTTGLGCLEQGVLHAIPAALLGAFILRDGFATRPATAALAGGALAGLTGIAFLELHCVNFEAPHQLIWHIAVMPVCAALGALIAWAVTRPASAHS